jgi:aerobic-type carbon monoxide dehydrogenase small subunit (CoxS/CutS family)
LNKHFWLIFDATKSFSYRLPGINATLFDELCVSCVTPVARVHGRSVTTIDGLPDADRWADSFCAHGGSQCGFCTPGIIMRAAALGGGANSEATVRQAMLAHLCRCTGWQPIVESMWVAWLLSADLNTSSSRGSTEVRNYCK